MKSLLTATSLLVLAAAAPALGQTTPPTTIPPAGTVVTPPAASAAEATTLAPQDRNFVEQAAVGGRTEVELGKLAEKQAASPAVKVFGRWMATDHALVDARLTMIAHQLGLEMPTRPDQQNQAVIDRLSGLAGVQFDRAYIQQMVSDHQKDLSDFRQEAQNTQNLEIRRFAQRVTPILEQHLAAARELAAVPEVASGSSMPAPQGVASSEPTGPGSTTQQLNSIELNRLQSQ